jgi:choline-glycine betaine transporter
LNPSRAIKRTWGAIMAGMAAILLRDESGGIDAIRQ